jgi:hypothetical protein
MEHRSEGSRPWHPTSFFGRGRITDCHMGSDLNVFGIGLMMWCLQHAVEQPSWDTMQVYTSRKSKSLARGQTIGNIDDQVDEDDKHPGYAGLWRKKESVYSYSDTLKTAIKECLFIEPSHRIKAASLVYTTRIGLHDSRVVGKRVLPSDPLPSVVWAPHPDPKVNPR